MDDVAYDPAAVGRAAPRLRKKPTWPSDLVDEFWASDGRPFGDLVPDFVSAIKKLRTSDAEELALLIFSSPKAHRRPELFKELLKPARGLKAGPRALELILDAAGFPPGKDREGARTAFNVLTRHFGGVSVSALIETSNRMRREEANGARFDVIADEATRRKASRARAKLGGPRKRGRPREIGRP